MQIKLAVHPKMAAAKLTDHRFADARAPVTQLIARFHGEFAGRELEAVCEHRRFIGPSETRAWRGLGSCWGMAPGKLQWHHVAHCRAKELGIGGCSGPCFGHSTSGLGAILVRHWVRSRTTWVASDFEYSVLRPCRQPDAFP